MTSDEASVIMATNPEDRQSAPTDTARYIRRPRLEDGLFVYDYVGQR